MADNFVPESSRPYFNVEGLQDFGLLWLINRVVFHPRGLALAVRHQVKEDGTREFVGFKLLGDGSEPMSFSEEDDDKFYKRVELILAACVDPETRL